MSLTENPTRPIRCKSSPLLAACCTLLVSWDAQLASLLRESAFSLLVRSLISRTPQRSTGRSGFLGERESPEHAAETEMVKRSSGRHAAAAQVQLSGQSVRSVRRVGSFIKKNS
ncbi:predicted protein [Chaetomium globosum CBS 148.51]|uniref:Uncharacterized protein n=1 Tax=Chaetomium globosum (strain ATCC 6205 / CBS 148.51 / DSM 1962 / NBRC 6347 / NRRL 1970) TaxID=306901 RepID=Q2H295_CHAGB|nr:uncharacterized protein CHGG_04101 [Chaetomium globosum CBS 148.51]EAQ87482.1 predicted protein [Chaetomium globosum CBS 148.51]